ncbi:unnamed protein product [Clonostachys rosea]|uniref:Major facilitator superfamily (MFS) profile domain-containing protein n=1 Tax=Bionectria ochroleuca TaxID=29856 RepID=A0ABY6UCP2_BIOOC|nr:unnamed protein product [Clonostachys rosea]
MDGRYQTQPINLPLREVEEDAAVIEPSNSVSVQPTPPNGGYGWVCTLSVFLINAHTWGINSSWAVIMAHLSTQSDQIKTTHFQWALVGGISISQALLISPIVNPLINFMGLRMTLIIGTKLVFVSLLASSFATQFWHLFLSQGICFGWGMGLTYIPASVILPSWFSTRRSLAVGISASGAGLGGLVYSLVANSAIQKFDVSWTYRILAFCSLAANSVASALIKVAGNGTHMRPTNPPFRFGDFRRVEIPLVVLWGMATDLGYITLLYTIPSYSSSIGLTPTQGSIANAMFNLGLGLGRPIIGYLSDAFGRINMAMTMASLCALLCFAIWIPANSFGVVVAFSFLVGPLCGAFWASVHPVLAEVVGLPRLANTFSIICLSLVIPTTFAESIAMQLVMSNPDRPSSTSASYLRTQVFVGCMFLTGSLSLWLLRAWRAWKMSANEAQVGERLSASGLGPATGGSWLKPRFLFGLWKV